MGRKRSLTLGAALLLAAALALSLWPQEIARAPGSLVPLELEATSTPEPTSTPVPPTPTPTARPEDRTPPLTVEQALGPQRVDTSVLPPENIRTLIATGDVIPARMVNYRMVTRDSFTSPFEPTADFIRDADLTFINLEAPVVKGCQPVTQGMTFCGDPRFIEGLAFAGVDVVNLANNHSGNYGPQGIKETIDLLSSRDIAHTGVGNLAVVEVRGLRFGFLGYNGVGFFFDQERIKQDIADARTKVNLVVVAFHWGKEYVAVPENSPGIAPDDPVQIAHLAIDAGADLIIGNHPHWVQGVEIYKEKFIAYAHGNFIFDQMWSRETREGVVGRYTFYGTRLIDVEYRPVLIEDYSQPRFVTGQEAESILNRMRQASAVLAQVR